MTRQKPQRVPMLSGSEFSLRRALGNQGMGKQVAAPMIQKKCACGGRCSACSAKDEGLQKVQAKLTVGPAHDVYEQEADRVADQVMRMPERSEIDNEGVLPALSIQRISSGDAGGFDPGAGFRPNQGGGQPLSPATRRFMEPRFGTDFGAVRVHTGTQAEASAASIQARAYTFGRDITLGKGASENDTHLMAHELTHVVQQGASPSLPLAHVQRARLPCTSERTVNVYGINLPGATGDITADVANANPILCQCGIELNVVGGESWQTDLLDRDAPNGVLNAPSGTVRPLTTEENEMLSYRPGPSDAVHVYYVPSFSGPKVAEAFWPSQHGERACAISNSPNADSFPHELMHVLLDNGNHHADPDNLMASGGSRNVGVDNLEPAQCASL